MAEIILKIDIPDNRGGANYGDGDIIETHNDRKILQKYTEKICHVKNTIRESNGNLSTDSLPWHLQNTTYKYKFTRLNRNEIEKEDLSTRETERFNNTSNAKGERIDVSEFVKRRKLHPRNRIFGLDGAEIWFGGTEDFSQIKLDLVWDEIEIQTGLLRADHKDLIVSLQELKKRLYLKCIDFSDLEAASMLEFGATVYKRNQYVDFKTVPELNSRLDDIYDNSKAVDVRSLKLFDTNTIKIKKI